MNKINPIQYIEEHDPVEADIRTVSSWFAWEYTYVETTEEERGTLAWLLAQGWQVYASSTKRIVGRSQTEITGYMYWLRRWKMQSEKVLQDMITDFTNAYNNGQTVNDDRYDELVTLYAAMVSNTEDEMISWISDQESPETSIQDLIDLFPVDVSDYETAVDSVIDDLGSGREDLINIAFNQKVADAKNAMINRGFYNTTTWVSTEAGIERERQIALNDLERNVAEQTISVEQSILNAKSRMREAILDAWARLQRLWRDKLLVPTEVRNRAFQAMLNFMERRTDEYPSLDALAAIAAQLGYGDASGSAPPS